MKRFKKRPFWKRVILFIIVVIAWFALVNIFSEEETDSISNARNVHSHWLLMVLILAIICPLFFYSKKQQTGPD